MSRNRRGNRKPSGTAAPNVQALGTFDAAQWSPRRAYLNWGTLDTRKELTGNDRITILRKARKMYADVGLARRIVNGVANLVGYLKPQADTPDREFNRMAEELFYERAGTAFVFDRAAKLDFFQWQIALTRLRIKDGDCLSVLSETQAGTANIIFYESHQIANSQERSTVDGVYLDKFGRHLGYNLIDLDDTTKSTRVRASDSIFYADFERPGQVRGISALAHALNNIQDQAEITADVKHGIKMANQVGLVRTMKGNNGPQGFASAVTAKSIGGSTINVEQMREGGMVAQLLENEQLSVIHDGRPHPNQMVLLEWLVRDIAWGVGLSPEVLWDLAKQTGPSQRYLMAETQRWIEHEQARLKTACQRFWTYFIAKAVKNGELPPPPPNWWWAEWIPQADLTIDRGREGNLELAQYEAGFLTLNDIAAKRGRDWESVEMQKAREMLRRREIEQEMGLEPGALDGNATKELNQANQNENMVSNQSQD
jgi:hypothetical protein